MTTAVIISSSKSHCKMTKLTDKYQMKKDIDSFEIYAHKACINHKGKQQ